MKTIRITGGLATFLLAAGCVAVDAPATASGPLVSSFVPNPGMPAEAVVSVRRYSDTPNIPDMVILKYYPDKVSPTQVAAAPALLCRSISKRNVFSEYMPQPTSHAGPEIAKLMVRCE